VRALYQLLEAFVAKGAPHAEKEADVKRPQKADARRPARRVRYVPKSGR